MLLRLLVIASLVVTTACSSAPKEEGAEENAAAEGDVASTDEGLTDEPMNEEGGEDVSDAGATAKPAQKSLFDRVGGMAALEKFSSAFIDALATHPPLQKNANIVKAMKADQTKHKKMLAEFFCQQTGGPCKYSGRDMQTAHAPLKMTTDEWNSIRGLFIRTLKGLGVQKAERMEMATIAARQKKLIVTQ